MSKAEKQVPFPFDNCGLSGHWAYKMERPNYEVYLAKQRAKSGKLKRSKAGGTTSGVVAIRNNTGTGLQFIYHLYNVQGCIRISWTKAKDIKDMD